MNHDQASSMMNARSLTPFGFPPTCDMCNDPGHGSPFRHPGHSFRSPRKHYGLLRRLVGILAALAALLGVRPAVGGSGTTLHPN